MSSESETEGDVQDLAVEESVDGGFFENLVSSEPLSPFTITEPEDGDEKRCREVVAAAQQHIDTEGHVPRYYISEHEGHPVFRYSQESRLSASVLMCYLGVHDDLLQQVGGYSVPDDVPSGACGFVVSRSSAKDVTETQVFAELFRCFGRGKQNGQKIYNNYVPSYQLFNASDASCSVSSNIVTRKSNYNYRKEGGGDVFILGSKPARFAVKMTKRNIHHNTNSGYRVRLFTLYTVEKEESSRWHKVKDPLLFYMSVHSFFDRPYEMVRYKAGRDVKESFTAKLQAGASFSAARKRTLDEIQVTAELPHPSHLLSDGMMKHAAKSVQDRVKERRGRPRMLEHIDVEDMVVTAWNRDVEASGLDKVLFMDPSMKGLAYRLLTDDRIKGEVVLGLDWLFGTPSHMLNVTISVPYLHQKSPRATTGFSSDLDERSKSVTFKLAVAIAARHDQESTLWALENIQRAIFETGKHVLSSTKRPTAGVTMSDDEPSILAALRLCKMTENAERRQCQHHFVGNVAEKCRVTGISREAKKRILMLLFGSVQDCTVSLDGRLDGFVHRSREEQMVNSDDFIESVIAIVDSDSDSNEEVEREWRRYLHGRVLPRCQATFNGKVPIERRLYVCTEYNNATESHNRLLKDSSDDLRGGALAMTKQCKTAFKQDMNMFRLAVYYSAGSVSAAKFVLSPYGQLVKDKALREAGASSDYNRKCVVAKAFGISATAAKPTSLNEVAWNQLVSKREEVLQSHAVQKTPIPSTSRQDGVQVQALTFHMVKTGAPVSAKMNEDIVTVGEEKLADGSVFYRCLNRNSRQCDFYETSCVSTDPKAPKKINVFVCWHTMMAYDSPDHAALAVQKKIDSEPARVLRLSVEARGAGQKGSGDGNGKPRRNRPTPGHQQRPMICSIDPFLSPADTAYWQRARKWNASDVHGGYNIQCNTFSLLISHWAFADGTADNRADPMAVYQAKHIKKCANYKCKQRHFALHETDEKGLFGAHFEEYTFGGDQRTAKHWRLLHVTRDDVSEHLPSVTCAEVPGEPAKQQVVLAKSLHQALLQDIRNGGQSESAQRITSWLESQFGMDIAELSTDGTLRYASSNGHFPAERADLVDKWTQDDYDFE